MNVTAFMINRSSARADDEGVNNNNIFYLYHTFKTENKISVQFTDVLGREQPTQLLLDRAAALQKAAAGEGDCSSPGSFWPCQLGAPHPCPSPSSTGEAELRGKALNGLSQCRQPFA